VTSEHLSDSTVQQKAEAAIISALAEHLGVPDSLRPRKLSTPGGSSVQLDACSEDKSVLVEAYARQGKLKGAQIKKISQDVLKLALLKRDDSLSSSRAIIVFASEEARASITGWVRSAADQFGVELMVVDIPEDVRDDIRSAQARQVMVNVQVAADEVVEDISIRLTE